MMQKSWMAHLEELRKRLILSFVIVALACIPVYLFYDVFFRWLTEPVRPILEERAMQLFAVTVYEAFLVKLKFTVLAAFIFSLPVHMVNLCGFIIPGLKKKETDFLFLLIGSVFLLGAGGVFYAYQLVIPGVFDFFLSSGFYPSAVGTLLNLDSTLFFIVQLLLSFLVIMQFPIVLIGLLSFRLVTISSLIKSARYVVVFIFILAALLTPPDVFSQLAVAAPLVLMYFLTIGIGSLIRIKKKYSK